MKNEWILDVLTDLRAFAQSNELPNLADHLERTQALALSELSQGGDVARNGIGVRKAAASARAGNNA